MVSIITPAYNAKEYIHDTIKSVMDQTYSQWELIIIDDCSTDNTFDIAQEYATIDSRIKVIRTSQNGGVARARNIGLEQASGDYIAFVDSDDLWVPEKLSKQVTFMQSKGCILSFTDFQRFNANDGVLGRVIKCPKKMKASDILRNTAIGCLTVMVDRKKVGDFRMPLLNHTEDNVTWYNILKRMNSYAYNLGEVLSYYREGNASLTKNKGKSAMQQWKTYREYFHFSIIRSTYYYCCYVLNAILRYF